MRDDSYLNSLFNLDGKVVLLTGAGGNLVGEISRSSALAGMKVVCCDMRLEDARRTTDQIGSFGGEALPFKMDVRNPADFSRALGLY